MEGAPDLSTLEGRNAAREAEIIKVKRFNFGNREMRFSDGLEFVSYMNLATAAVLAVAMVLDLTFTGGALSTLFAQTFGASILHETLVWTGLALLMRGLAGEIRSHKIDSIRWAGIIDRVLHAPAAKA